MAPETIEIKVQRLEERVTRFEQLPERMDRLESQFLQLRTELRDEFSAVRQESLARENRVVATLREEIHSTNRRTVATLREENHTTNERMVTTLRDEIRAGDGETRRFMRILHEKVISDIATLGEARQTQGPKRARSKKQPRS